MRVVRVERSKMELLGGLAKKPHMGKGQRKTRGGTVEASQKRVVCSTWDNSRGGGGHRVGKGIYWLGN